VRFNALLSIAVDFNQQQIVKMILLKMNHAQLTIYRQSFADLGALAPKFRKV